MDRPAGVCNSEVRAHSADYIDFGCQRGRLVDRDLGGRPAAGLRRSRSPPLDLATLGCEDRDGCNEVPSRRETQLSAYMRSGEDAKEAFKSPGTVLRSSSLPERCFYERCKPSGSFTEVPSALPTNPDWLKTRLAALAEESELPKVKVRLNRPKNTEIPSPLTGHGERTKCRSPSPRLLGEGVAIGEANKASLGVPWRSLPVYSKGALCQTMITGLSTTRRVQALSEFSEKLNSNTTKELIYPENNGKATEADGHFKNWLISVQNSLQSLNIVRAPIPTPRISITRAGSPTLTEKQQQCKPLKKYLESDQGTKDACPFARNDSDSAARETRPPTVHVRIHVTPATSRRTIDVLPGTLIHEKNRTWQFQQDMAEVRNGVTLLSPKNTPRGTMLLKSKDPVLKSGDLSASQSTLEPDQSTRTPLSPLSPIYSSYSTEAARPRWR